MNRSLLDMALELQKKHGYVTEEDILEIASQTSISINLVLDIPM